MFLKKISKLNTQKKFFLFVILFDIIYYLLKANGYYFTFLSFSSNTFLIILTLIATLVLVVDLKLKKFWIVLGTIVILPIALFKILLNVAVTDFSTSSLRSEDGSTRVFIEHRNATLGETHHFYNFYRETKFPLISEKLNNNLVEIVTRGFESDGDADLQVLGYYNDKWSKDGKYVTFHSEYADTTIPLND